MNLEGYLDEICRGSLTKEVCKAFCYNSVIKARRLLQKEDHVYWSIAWPLLPYSLIIPKLLFTGLPSGGGAGQVSVGLVKCLSMLKR